MSVDFISGFPGLPGEWDRGPKRNHLTYRKDISKGNILAVELLLEKPLFNLAPWSPISDNNIMVILGFSTEHLLHIVPLYLFFYQESLY